MSGGPAGRPRSRSTRQKDGPTLGERLTWGFVFVGVISALIWVMWPIFSILLAAAAFAYLLDPIADRLEARGMARVTGISAIFAVATSAILFFLLVLLPIIAAQFVELSGNVRGYLDNLVAMIQPAAAFIEEQTGQTIPVDLGALKAELPELLGRLSPDAREGIKDFLSQFFASSVGLFTAILNLALLPIFTFYLLNEWDRIVAFFGNLIPLRHRARTTRLARCAVES